MSSSKAAERYAKSLYQLSKEKGAVEAVLSDILHYQETISKSRDLEVVIASPIIPGTRKQSILDAIFSSRFQSLTTLFFKLIVAKGREKELSSIASAFIQEDKKQKGIKECTLTTASPLTEEIRKELYKKAEGMAGGKISVTESVNPELIGGYIISVQDLQLDESVRTKLIKLREQLLDHSYVPKIDLI